MSLPRSTLGCLLLLSFAGSACSAKTSATEPSTTGSGDKIKVVAAIYPLAWAAEQVGGDRVEVTDLTPPGVEAHDVSLTAQQLADIQEADVVLKLAPGFQPALDDAVGSAGGTVYDVSRPLTPLLPADQRDDPHVWLSPQTMELIAHEASVALSHADSGYAKDYAEQETNVVGPELTKLTQEYDRGLKTCEFRSFVDTHEAFGMLAHYENLRQIGIEGLTPESEPSADRLKVAEDAIAAGTAAPAIFYEPTDEGKRIGESVAADADVRALPLDPLEAAPPSGDLLSVFRANLATLKDGLSCQS